MASSTFEDSSEPKTDMQRKLGGKLSTHSTDG